MLTTSSPSTTRHSSTGRSAAAHSATRSAPRSRSLLVTEVVEDIHRVEVDTHTVGYVVRAGAVYVSLEGQVYNTSVEVGQSLDLDAAVEALLTAVG